MTLTLDDVLGPGPGTSAEVRARASTKRFVRSLDQLAEHTPGATGRQLSASEALDAYGYDVLGEVAAEGGALLSVTPDAAGHAIRSQRDRLGLSTRAVAARAKCRREISSALSRTHETYACGRTNVLRVRSGWTSANYQYCVSLRRAQSLRCVCELSARSFEA